ncbi:hypothetical protein JHK86_008128 [Glycine max]|nr:hypothetical protein JHK86_008128 [Glycine max]
MRIVGLTGGIASGKSTVSNLFKSHDVPVVDADIVAREVLRKGSGGWKKVVAAFGDEILLENGEVNRPSLGQIVFSDPDKRQFLNRLLAPYISRGIFWDILKLWMKGYKVIVLDVPLLFEAKMDRFTKPVIVVWVDPETQIQRLLARDKSGEEDARNRINAQMSLDVKRGKANIVIDNTGSLDDLNQQFQKVLVEVTRPLTWTEFSCSRQGVFTILASVASGLSAGAGTEPYLLCSVVSFFGLKVRKLFLLYFDYLSDSNSILVTIVFKNMQYAVAIVCDLEPVA